MLQWVMQDIVEAVHEVESLSASQRRDDIIIVQDRTRETSISNGIIQLTVHDSTTFCSRAVAHASLIVTVVEIGQDHGLNFKQTIPAGSGLSSKYCGSPGKDGKDM